MARIELSNIGGGGTTLSLTTTGTSGASTLAGSVLNIPIYQGQLTLTTTGTSGAATLSGTTLNIPQYSGGGGTPAGSAGQVQFNSTPAGSFAASSNLAWVNSASYQLNIGAPSSPTGNLNVKGSGALTTVNTRLTNSGHTELLKVLDNGSTNIGTNFNWDNTNGRLGIGTTTPSNPLSIVAASGVSNYFSIERSGASNASFGIFNYTGATGIFSPMFFAKSNYAPLGPAFLLDVTTDVLTDGPIGAFIARANNAAPSNRILFDFSNFNPSEISGGKSVLRIFASSNISIQNGGTPLNNGYRLDVNANGATHCTRLRAPNASSGTNVFLVQNNNPDDIHKIEANGKISYLANAISGTTGNQTINTPSGNVNFAVGATALTVTNSLCTTSSLVFATVRTNDATAYIKNVVPAASSFTINLGAAATAVTSVGFFIIN